MAETPNGRAASAAAREFLHTKVDRIGDLAEAAPTVDAAVEARAAADRHTTDSQQAYSRTGARRSRRAGRTRSCRSSAGWPSVGRSHYADAAPQPPPGLRSRPRPHPPNSDRLTPARPPRRPPSQ